ncbi:MAG: 2,3-bisphosphoglycerate-independent phosphoglycerate mutase [candidate division WOR-3 bacterium]
MNKRIEELIIKNSKKILLVVLDGLGGLPLGKTELESAHTPNLDFLTKRSSLGLTIPIDYGITPGSGSAHLALFGYDPSQYEIGRGVMEALGVGLDIGYEDLCIRANFATKEKDIITDRRAKRLKGYNVSPDEKNRELCKKLQKEIKEIKKVKVIIEPGKEHRFVIVLRGENLSPEVEENDPLKDNLPVKEIKAKDKDNKEAKFTAFLLKELVRKAEEVLKKENKANYILLRGYSKKPKIPSFLERFKLNPACIAVYPMYKGIAKLLGMEVLATEEGKEVETLKENRDKFDFFYLHFKETDMRGEDGDFSGKVKAIEKFDKILPEILKMEFDVLSITSDHSTPSLLKSHSWHPNPFLLFSPFTLPDGFRKFTERNCAKGSLGIFPATKVMPLLLAHSLKLKKFGA